jgi:transcriptional regulator of aromatic amino acid metabolism
MKNPVSAGATVPEPVNCGSPLSDDWSLARAAHIDLRAMGMPRVNLLLIGPDAVVWNVLESLLMDLTEPILSWYRGEPLALPATDASGTLILHDVADLARDEQRQLLEWLEQTMGSTQVISTASQALLPRVQAGLFDDVLYYRLNTVCMDVTAERE